MRKLLCGLVLALAASAAFAQSAIIRGEASAGTYENLKSSVGVLYVNTYGGTGDPCAGTALAKSSVAINITSATTTQLVALATSKQIFVCGFQFTISQVVTTANTLKFVTGTGASCGTGTTDLTGLFGAGGVTASAPIVITSSVEGTDFATPVSQALCATTVIGGSGSFQGVLSYIQL